MNHPGDREVERAREFYRDSWKEVAYKHDDYMRFAAAYSSSRDAELERLRQENALLRCGAPLPEVRIGVTANNSTPMTYNVVDAQKLLVAELVGALEKIVKVSIYPVPGSYEKCWQCGNQSWAKTPLKHEQGCVVPMAESVLARAKEAM